MKKKYIPIISNINNKKVKFLKSLSEVLISPHYNDNNKKTLKNNKSDAKINTSKIFLPKIKTNKNYKNHIILLNNAFNSQTINNSKLSSNCFISKKPLESKKFKTKIIMKKNKSNLNIYNICLKNDYQKLIRNIRYYNLNTNSKLSHNNNINDIYTNYLYNYNQTINSIYVKNKMKNIKKYNIISPFEDNFKFNNDKLNKLYLDKKINVNMSINEEKTKLKKLIKKRIFHNVFFKWKKDYYSFDEKINIMDTYQKLLKLSIKNDIKTLFKFFSQNNTILINIKNRNKFFNFLL